MRRSYNVIFFHILFYQVDNGCVVNI